MPETIWAVNGCPPDSSRDSFATSVSISSDFISTRQRQRAHTHRSSSRTSPDTILSRLFPRRSPQRSSANAARGGLEPLPAERLWRASNLHLPYSTALSEAPSLSTSRVRAHNKTLKYLPEFPASFASLADARQFCASFFHEYNYIHRHSGIAWHTPASVHFGTAGAVDQARQNTLTAAYHAHPERFSRRPHPPVMPEQSWINQPVLETQMN
ncbi:MAG: integrase core domain-containing protein [Streptosporangiaceae bacterium]